MDRIRLWEKTPAYHPQWGGEEPYLRVRMVVGAKICVIVIPGGAYEHLAEDHEGEKIAARLNREGISAMILHYRSAPYRYPVELEDVLRAVRVTRSLADVYGYHPQKIAVMGFSAGGHLASMALTRFDYGKNDGDKTDRISCRPNAGILCYPVILTDGEFAHCGSADNLIGKPTDQDPISEDVRRSLQRELSSNENVREDTPPCFLWHTAADGCVPVENTLAMASALSAKKIPFEAHIYPYGEHGLGLAEKMPYVSGWAECAIRFLHLMLDTDEA